MNDFKWDRVSRSIGDVASQITRVDERLAGLFGNIAEIIVGIQREHEEEMSPNNLGREISDKIGGGKMINTIPFGEPCGCLEECLAVAFGRIDSKDGFNKIAIKLVEHWLRCCQENCRTLIITNSWDVNNFYRKFKGYFDSYTSSASRNHVNHTVAVVLLGDAGFSVQYLK